MTFDSVDLSGSTYGLTLEGVSGTIGASARTDITEIPFGYGGTSRDGGYRPRNITANCKIIGSSTSNLMTKLDALKLLLDGVGHGERSLIIDGQTDRYWLVRSIGQIDGHFVGDAAYQAELRFVASDSRAYSTTARTTPDFSITGGIQTKTIESATVIPGTTYTDPVWTFTVAGSHTALKMENLTTGETLNWTGTLSAGHLLKVDSALWRVSKSTDSGTTYVDSMTNVTGAFPRLVQGVQNSVRVTGMASTTMALTYRARYL